jgi:hypothetical protein
MSNLCGELVVWLYFVVKGLAVTKSIVPLSWKKRGRGIFAKRK